jgi:hypothetical protein
MISAGYVPGDGVVAGESRPDPHRRDTSHTPVRTGSRCAQLRGRSGAHRRPAQPRPIQTLSARQARGRRRVAATLRTFVDGHEASDLQPAPPVGASPCSTVLPEMTRPPPAARVISTRRGWVCPVTGAGSRVLGGDRMTATRSTPQPCHVPGETRLRGQPAHPTGSRSRSSPAGINRCSAVYPARVCSRTCDGPLRLA